MSTCRLRILESTAELRAAAAAWDDLWLRAEIDIPTLRAEFLADWIEHFAPRAGLRLLLVEQAGRAVAALPLVGRRMKRLVETGAMPTNGWTAGGELLLDRALPAGPPLAALAAAVRRLPWAMLYLNPVHYEAPRWQALCRALTDAGCTWQTRPTMRIGTVRFPETWEEYRAGFSGRHRRNLGRAWRKLCERGPTEFEDHPALRPEQVGPLLRAGFEIEDRSWKGTAAGSVLRTPGMADFYLRQAERMAALGFLRLHFLVHGGRRIAFQYGWQAKQTYFSPKIGYDPAFAEYSPGQLLTGHVLQRCHGEAPRPNYDFHGDPTDAVARWTNGGYTVGTLAVAVRPLVGGALLRAWQWRTGTPIAAN